MIQVYIKEILLFFIVSEFTIFINFVLESYNKIKINQYGNWMFCL